MARQKGLIKLRGQLGDLSFYKSKKDGFLAREKGGIDADRIKNDPSFERTRENGAEFGRAGNATKLLRKALRNLLLNVADSRMTNRLVSEMMKVIQADKTNLRGKRNVIDGEAELLKGFEFNVNGKLYTTFLAPLIPLIDRVAGSLVVTIPAFVPKDSIAAPPSSTHCKLNAAALELDFETGTFTVNSSSSPEVVIGPQAEATVTLTNAVTPASTHPLFLVFGINFYQFVNGVYYPLKNGFYNSLALVDVDGGV